MVLHLGGKLILVDLGAIVMLFILGGMGLLACRLAGTVTLVLLAAMAKFGGLVVMAMLLKAMRQ